MMEWCPCCKKHVTAVEEMGRICCTSCARVIISEYFSNRPDKHALQRSWSLIYNIDHDTNTVHAYNGIPSQCRLASGEDDEELSESSDLHEEDEELSEGSDLHEEDEEVNENGLHKKEEETAEVDCKYANVEERFVSGMADLEQKDEKLDLLRKDADKGNQRTPR